MTMESYDFPQVTQLAIPFFVIAICSNFGSFAAGVPKGHLKRATR